MSKKTIITAAITGGIHVPSMSPYLPQTVEQIVDEAVNANKAGAAIVHIHARVPETGKPTTDLGIMTEIVSGIKSQSDVVICITTGGAVGMSVEERLKAIPALHPELASCNSGSVNFCLAPIADRIKEFKYDWEEPYLRGTYDIPFVNTFYGIENYVKTMHAAGTKPEFEVYDVGMINNLAYFQKKGLLKAPIYLQFVMGIMGGIPATVENLVFMHKTAKEMLGEENFVWSCTAAGKVQFDILTAALTLGGNVRVGLEDNLYLKKGVFAKSNAESVEKIRKIAETLDREIASPDDAREILGLTPLAK
jgi:uncharacterized protein (DUF849 family)